MKSEFSHKSILRISILLLAFVFLALAVFIHGCSDNSESPQPSPASLSISISCVDGAPEVHITNDGGPMAEQSFCRVLYEDGTPDSISLDLDENESTTCRLSNMHGGVTVGIEGTDLEESVEDCIAPATKEMLETFIGAVNLAALIPTPLTSQNILLCHYDIFLESVTHDVPTVSVERINGGMNLCIVFANFRGDIRAETSDFLCVDFTGDFSISSIVYNAQIMFVTNPDETVGLELVNSDTVINDLDVQIDGFLGFLVSWLANFFMDNFVDGLEYEIETGFDNTIVPVLSDIVVKEISCE